MKLGKLKIFSDHLVFAESLLISELDVICVSSMALVNVLCRKSSHNMGLTRERASFLLPCSGWQYRECF
jgi:hypothetical protein